MYSCIDCCYGTKQCSVPLCMAHGGLGHASRLVSLSEFKHNFEFIPAHDKDCYDSLEPGTMLDVSFWCP